MSINMRVPNNVTCGRERREITEDKTGTQSGGLQMNDAVHRNSSEASRKENKRKKKRNFFQAIIYLRIERKNP